MEQSRSAEGLTAQDIEELETRVRAAELRAVSLEREVKELKAKVSDRAELAVAVAAAEVELAAKDVAIARLDEGVRVLAEQAERAGVQQMPNRVRRARGLRRIVPRTATTAEKTLDGVAELGPLTLAEPALRWVGEIVEADK